MMFLRKILPVILLALMAAPAWAGVEPFYKGDWNMSPAEIEALESGKPEMNTFNAQNSGYLEYSNNFMGLDGLTDYYFRDGKLYGVRLINGFEDTRMSRAEAVAYYNRLKAAFEQKLKPSSSKTFETVENGDPKYCFYMVSDNTILEGSIIHDADNCVWLNINAADIASPLSREHIQDYDKIRP